MEVKKVLFIYILQSLLDYVLYITDMLRAERKGNVVVQKKTSEKARKSFRAFFIELDYKSYFLKSNIVCRNGISVRKFILY